MEGQRKKTHYRKNIQVVVLLGEPLCHYSDHGIVWSFSESVWENARLCMALLQLAFRDKGQVMMSA